MKKQRRGVRDASLDYRTLATRSGNSLVHVSLHTGRTHQIRVQFSSRKHPLVGDGKYGGSDNGAQIGLWLKELRFFDPKTGEPVCISALPSIEQNPWSEIRPLLEAMG